MTPPEACATASSPDDTAAAARTRLDQVARASYGRLLAILGAPTRDIVMAEDALGDEPEALGLAGLISMSRSRAGARGSPSEFGPLEQQDTTRWDAGLIAEW
jgi:predicted RNA polymerase sigma factor